jgi:predicted  nucleic acid-binding Zn-ribbon protein
MSVTAKLLSVFRVEQMLRGLKSRLNTAEKFLAEQERQLKAVDAEFSKAAAELKQIKTSIAGEEGETASIDARMEKLREQMGNSKTNKEYSAFLSELNSLKAKKDEIEKHELEEMSKVEELQKKNDERSAARDERLKIVDHARKDRDAKSAEIKDRVAELTAQRDALAKDVPVEAIKMLNDALQVHGDEAMSAVEVVDRRNHEWSCGNCQMTLPVETVNAISMGKLTRCISCKCVLYTEEDVVSKKKPKENEDIVKSKRKAAKKSSTDAGATA